MSVARWPDESPEYKRRRDELHAAEVALRDQRERVAELRRTLPLDNVMGDERFHEIRDGEMVDVRLADLFANPTAPLVLMHFMYGGAQTEPCPMCTCWADGYDALIPHLEQRANFAIFVAGDPRAFSDYAHGRGWKNARVVSSGPSDLKRRLGFESQEGAQLPGASVFVRESNGEVHHFYSVSALLGKDGSRGMDLLNPLWHFFDLLPEGRGDFMPRKSYDAP